MYDETLSEENDVSSGQNKRLVEAAPSRDDVRKSVKQGVKADVLVADMAQRIVDGQLAPSSLLASENELSQQYSMSRPHVRQALQRLAAAGLIETRHGLGSCVNPKRAWNLFDPMLLHAFVQSGNLAAIATELVELRRMVEVECCRLAAGNIRRDELHDLEMWLTRMEAALDNSEVMAQADVRFHDVIIAASRNRFLQGIMSYLAELLTQVRTLTMQTGGLTGRRRAQTHHQMIYDVLVAGDANAAEDAMRAHMKQLEEDMTQALLVIADSN